ncbi:MAG: hypothetical protein FWH14_06010 [Oscillospiraceae bacterium]|nr:hypothetical protein [Oscillospiraceae bacterium]
MKVYLDNCCFNRPFDDQSSLVVRLETEAKLYIQDLIKEGDLDLVWSFVLDYENDNNPFEEVRERVAEWKEFAVSDWKQAGVVTSKANELMNMGLRVKDAFHVACAIFLDASYFITTDKKILNKHINEVECINPIDFIRRYYNEN